MPEEPEKVREGFWKRHFGKEKKRPEHKVAVPKETPEAVPEKEPDAPPLMTPPPVITPPPTHAPVVTAPAPVSNPTPTVAVDLNNPDNWMVPLGGFNMEKGAEPAREHELDDIDDADPGDDEEEDEEGEEEEEDRDDIPTRPPAPKRHPPEPRPSGTHPPGTQPTSKEDLREIIIEKFEEGYDAYDIKSWLKDEGIVDEENGKYLNVRQITGYKSLLMRPQESQSTPAQPAAPQPAPLPQAAPPPVQQNPPTIVPTPPTPAAQKSKIVIPRVRTKLETFVDMLDKAMANNNEALAQIAVDGIYREMDKDAGGSQGGINAQVFELLKAQLESGKGKSKLTELKDLASIVKDLTPPQAEGKSEAVQMAEVMSNTTLQAVDKATDTALQISGSKGKADKTGKCPSCEKLIPMDSLYCGYCGLAFKQDIREEEEDEDEEDPEEMKMRQREEEQRKKRAGIARRAVNRTPPQQQRAPAAQQPSPMPAQPTAGPRPGNAAITPEERANLLRNLRRLANFISNKDDPVLKAQVLFKGGDDDDRKNGVFLSIIGRQKILAAAQRLLKEHPELSEFQHYVDLCDSVDGRVYIDTMLKELQNQAKLMGVYLKKEEAAEMLATMEARLGFVIE
jgi:hypothetical protein